MAVDKERLGSSKKFSVKEGRTKGQVRLLTARGSAELGGGLGKSQVIGEDRSRLPGKERAGEVGRGGRRASDRTKERIHRFRVRFR